MQNFDLVGEVECVWEVQAICGEGPLWIETARQLVRMTAHFTM